MAFTLAESNDLVARLTQELLHAIQERNTALSERAEALEERDEATKKLTALLTHHTKHHTQALSFITAAKTQTKKVSDDNLFLTEQLANASHRLGAHEEQATHSTDRIAELEAQLESAIASRIEWSRAKLDPDAITNRSRGLEAKLAGVSKQFSVLKGERRQAWLDHTAEMARMETKVRVMGSNRELAEVKMGQYRGQRDSMRTLLRYQGVEVDESDSDSDGDEDEGEDDDGDKERMLAHFDPDRDNCDNACSGRVVEPNDLDIEFGVSGSGEYTVMSQAPNYSRGST